VVNEMRPLIDAPFVPSYSDDLTRTGRIARDGQILNVELSTVIKPVSGSPRRPDCA
jgi:hypothetical protein